MQINLEDILKNCKDKGLIERIQKDIVVVDSGHRVFWPESVNGYLDEFHLILIAAILHKDNKSWDEEINATLG